MDTITIPEPARRAGADRRADRRRRRRLAVRPGDRAAGRSATPSASSTRGRWPRNPVMFVVEIGSVLTTLLFLPDLAEHGERAPVHRRSSRVWLWFTVLFANFAEAMAEGRGKAQADTLRKTRSRDRRPGSACADGIDRGAPSPQLRPRRPVRRRRRRDHPRRRRGRRGHRQRRRVGHHRRVGPGHPRVRRRPLARSPAAPGCCPTRSSCGSPPSRARRSSTG